VVEAKTARNDNAERMESILIVEEADVSFLCDHIENIFMLLSSEYDKPRSSRRCSRDRQVRNHHHSQPPSHDYSRKRHNIHKQRASDVAPS
jgi:hypothetical protein